MEPADHLDSLVSLGLRYSPALAAMQERILSARQMARAAGAPMDPMVGFALTGVDRPGGGLGEEMMSMAGIELSQAVSVPGKLRGRREASLAEARVLEAQLAAARRTLVSEIRGAYAQLFSIDRETEAMQAIGGLLDILSPSAAARYAAGEGDLTEPAQVQLERARLAERLDDLSAERAGSEARLNALLDRPAATPIRTTTALPGDLEDSRPFLDRHGPSADAGAPDGLTEQAVEQSAEVRMQREEVAAAERRVRVARLARWPDLTLGAEYGFRGRLDPVTTARVAVELPVWKRGKQDAELRAAEHDLRAREADLRALQAQVRAQADEARFRLSTADRQLRRYREEILPQAELIAEARRTAYATGRGGLDKLIEALRMRLEAESEAARRQAERFEAWTRWQAIAGPDFGAPTQEDAARGARSTSGEER